MNKPAHHYIALVSLVGFLAAGSMTNAIAEKPSFACKNNKQWDYLAKQNKDIADRYKGKDKRIPGTVQFMIKIWEANKIRKLCDQAKAGEEVDISCEAVRRDIDYDEVEKLIPRAALSGDKKALNDLRTKFHSQSIVTVLQAKQYCRELGVTK